MLRAARLALLLLVVPAAAQAAGCKDVMFEGASFTVCEADPGVDRIALALNDDAGARIATFSRLEVVVDAPLAFATNAGMYHPDRRPAGLYVEDGVEVTRIVTREGPGNFGLLPNGVLCLGEGTARVIESRAFAAERPACDFATQSGPMLVIGGKLHPRFLKDSTSRYIRNGVGVDADGVLHVAISNTPVNFHTFARLFRDELKTPNALFLDGNISRLHAPEMGRSDIGLPLGPMLYVTKIDGAEPTR